MCELVVEGSQAIEAGSAHSSDPARYRTWRASRRPLCWSITQPAQSRLLRFIHFGT